MTEEAPALPAPEQKSRTVYVVLALTLGFAGLHNFYARYWWRGAAQLAISLCSMMVGSIVTGIWAMIEAAMVTKDADGVPFFVKPSKARYRRTYVLLAIFLGLVGAHNFYARYWERGFLQCCLTIFGLSCGPIFALLMVDPAELSSRILTHLPWAVFVWALLEAWLVHNDAKGQELKSSFPELSGSGDVI